MSSIIYRHIGLDDNYKIWHKPEKNMFLLIHSGNGSIVSREKSYPMKRGTLCFIGCDKNHYTFPDIPENYVRTKLFLSSEELERVERLLSCNPELHKILGMDRISVGMLDEKSMIRAEELFKELSELREDAIYFHASLYSAVLELIAFLSRSMSEKTSVDFGNIQIAVEYINLHVTEDITVERICEVCHLSKYYFCRLFKQKIGMTVMEYVLKTRLSMSKELLLGSSMSVAEVSETCGFSGISYFSRTFKKEVGLSPLQYRRLNTKSRNE